MPAQPDPNQLGTDPRLLDRLAFVIPPSDLDQPLANSPSAASNQPSPPPPPNNQPRWEFINPHGRQYTLSDTLMLEGWVEDLDGIADIDRLDLELIVNGDRIAALDPVLQFITDPTSPQRATFRHSIDLKNLAIAEGGYNITLEGILYDRSGNGSINGMNFHLSNHHPRFHFDIQNRSYDASETISFYNTHVEDMDGLDDVSHIDLKLRRWGGPELVIDLPDITDFVSFGDPIRGTFDHYRLDLSTLNLPLGHYDWNLEGHIIDKAGNSSLWWSPTLNIRNHRPDLHFNLERRDYSGSETLTLRDVRVEDPDGIGTLDRIDFQLTLEDSRRQILDLADVTKFSSDHPDAQVGTFDYTVDLSTLPLSEGRYNLYLDGFLYDKFGNVSIHRERFDIENHKPVFHFDLNGDRFSANDKIALSNTIISEGIADIERIDFRAIVLNENNRLIDLADVTHFTPDFEDARHGTFTYDLDFAALNLAPDRGYDILLEAIAYTKAGLFSQQERSLRVDNLLPQSLQFQLDRQNYTSRDTLTISRGGVFDYDGSADVDRIDFRLRTDNGTFIDLPDVTAISSDPNNPDPGWAAFDYSVDLSALPLNVGTYNLTLEAIAFDRSGNGNSLFGQGFQFVQEDGGLLPGSETNLFFNLDQQQHYAVGDTLTLTNSWVEDFDGIADIERIDFFLETDRGYVIDLADVTQFIRHPDDPSRGTFNYSIASTELGVEPESDRNFTLVGIAYDRFGRSSRGQTANFTVSNRSPHFDFGFVTHDFDNRYGIGETLTVQPQTWVDDPDGLANLDRIDFRAIVNGEVFDLPDVTEFTPWQHSEFQGIFTYNLDLWTLPLQPNHSYNIELEGILYDKAGNNYRHVQPFFLEHRLPVLEAHMEGREYAAGEIVTLKDTWVRNVENIADIDRIDFVAIVNGEFVDLPDVTQFIPFPYSNDAIFEYNLDLGLLGLDIGHYNIDLIGSLYNKAGFYEGGFRQGFRVINEQPYFDFSIDSTRPFAAGETLTLQNVRVDDRTGMSDIDRVEFVAIVNGSEIIELPDVTEFIGFDLDPEGTFNYEIDLQTLGLDINRFYDVQLEGTIFDRVGNIFRHSQHFQVSNHLPHLDATIDRNQYGFNDTLNLQGWVEDPDGIAEIDRIDLRLFVAHENRYIDLADITEIGIEPGNQHRGMVDYRLDLASLGLDFGSYELFLETTAYDQAGNGRRGTTQSFILANHNQIPQLNFNLSQGEYLPEETLTVTEGWVEDLDGFTNIDRIEFSLRNLVSNEIVDVANVGTLMADPMNFNRGTFDYSLKLETLDLAAGNYALEGTIYDKQGNFGDLFERQFTIGFGQIAPQDLRFNLDNSTYAPNETVFLEEGWVKDENSGEDIARVDLRLLDVDNNLVADLNDVTSFELATWDSLWAGFGAAVDLNGLNLADGVYTLSAIAYDYADQTSNWFERDFAVKAPTPNFAPANLTFGLDRNSYKLTDTINLTNGWVRDENGAETLDRIDLRIFTEQGTVLDIDDITNLDPASWNQEWASFQFGASLQGLNLQGGSHKLIGIAYDTEGATSEQFERGFFLEVPQPNSTPTDLSFSLGQNSYQPTDTLTINNGWISDGDGAEDIESVSFKLVDGNGSEIDLGAIADLSIASWSPEWASFAGSFDLSQYNLGEGNYTLVGIARDKSGGESQTLSRAFTIETPQTNNTAPANLQFGLSGNTFSASDTLEITNGWVSDEDGNNDLAGVDFELVAEDGTIINIADSFDLTAATWDWSNQWSSFRHSIDFSVLGLTSGVYTLRGKAYDRAGDYSNAFSRSFTFV